MNTPKIDWINPIFPAFILMLMFVTAYGGLRLNHLPSLLLAIQLLFLAWTDQYLTGERAKRLPKESYLA